MPIQVAVLKESRPDEKRVAMVPAVADKLSKLGCQISLLSGAGLNSKLPDSAYTTARFVNTEPELLATANIVLAVQPPTAEQINLLPPGCILLSFVYPHKEPELTRLLRDKHITCFAMEQVPRISRAQAMDALSSQAALAGYYGALLGATKLARILPMMTTAVGSIRPARCLVMGLGVAGLQALATARRLGAITEGYDVRPETKEQAESLGAKFVDTGVDARGEGGYARELAPLAGHYPCLRLGPAWWFHDSPEGMRRFREMTTETAGFYNTVGFNDDTRAFLSIPARHDVARRIDCAFLARLVAEHRLADWEAAELAQELTVGLVRRAYRL